MPGSKKGHGGANDLFGWKKDVYIRLDIKGHGWPIKRGKEG